jgi:hypothetical protein
MKKAAALVFATVLLASAGSAAMIPSNITVDLNIDLFGGDEKENKKQQEKKQNDTYGERTGGQAVHTETKSNDPGVQRNTQEYGITEEDTNEGNDLGEMISAFYYNLIGEPGKAPDTGQPNSVY